MKKQSLILITLLFSVANSFAIEGKNNSTAKQQKKNNFAKKPPKVKRKHYKKNILPRKKAPQIKYKPYLQKKIIISKRNRYDSRKTKTPSCRPMIGNPSLKIPTLHNSHNNKKPKKRRKTNKKKTNIPENENNILARLTCNIGSALITITNYSKATFFHKCKISEEEEVCTTKMIIESDITNKKKLIYKYKLFIPKYAPKSYSFLKKDDRYYKKIKPENDLAIFNIMRESSLTFLSFDSKKLSYNVFNKFYKVENT